MPEERGRGGPTSELQSKFIAFLESDALRDIPVSLIATRMWTVIAQKAASGQKEPPNRGTVNDINVVSGLMPYCDVMLIDNKCRALLQDIPEKYALPYPTKVFSRSNGDELLEFIRSIEQTADPVVLKLVHEVYGDDWPTPFVTMYEYERQRTARDAARGAPEG